MAYFQETSVRVSQSIIPSGQQTAPSLLLSHSLGHHLSLSCYCFSLSLPWRSGLGSFSGICSHHSPSHSGLAVADLHCRGKLLSNAWDLGFQPAVASPCLHNFLWSEMGNSTVPSVTVVLQKGSLGLTVLQSLMNQLFEFYLLSPRVQMRVHCHKFRTHTLCCDHYCWLTAS